MGKNYLNSSEEFNEDDLPRVDLTEEKIQEIKENAFKIIDGLKKQHKELNFNIDEEKVLEIRKSLGKNPEKSIFGVENAKMIRALLINEIKEKEELCEENILYSYFTELPDAAWYWKGSVCYQMFITKERFLVYGFDAWYNISIEKNIAIEDIKFAGKGVGKSAYSSKDSRIIQLKDGTMFLLNPIYSGEHDDIDKLIEIMRSLGVKDIEKKGIPWGKIWLSLAGIVAFILLIAIVMESI